MNGDSLHLHLRHRTLPPGIFFCLFNETTTSSPSKFMLYSPTLARNSKASEGTLNKKTYANENKSPYVPNAADSFVRATILSTTSLTAKHQIINSSCTWICGLPLDKHGRPRRANSTSGYHAFCFPQRWMLGDLLEDLNAPFQLCKHERAVPSMFAELLDSRFQLLPKNSSN